MDRWGHVKRPNGDSVLFGGLSLGIPCNDEILANDRLVCAAPDMLTALREVMRTPGLQSSVQVLCAAAVAKATGQSIDEVIAGE
jgi:hypothetical protein